MKPTVLFISTKRALSLDDLRLLLCAYGTSNVYNDKLFLAIVFTAFWALLRLGETVAPDSLTLHSPRKMSLRYPLSITDNNFSFFLPMHKADRFYEGRTLRELQSLFIGSLARDNPRSVRPMPASFPFSWSANTITRRLSAKGFEHGSFF